MQELRFVGLTQDGTRLVLQGSEGTQFQVPLDNTVRAAVRLPRRTVSAGPVPDGELRPRDIQARIRAGESAEDLARTGRIPLERVRKYEGPVLAEREHVAREARRCHVRRPLGGPAAGTAAPPTLEEVLIARLADRAITEGDLDWDSWRRPDGRWTIRVSYLLDGELSTADFVFDLAGRMSVAEDEAAVLLLADPGPGAGGGAVAEDAAPVAVPAPARAVGENPGDPSAGVSRGLRLATMTPSTGGSSGSPGPRTAGPAAVPGAPSAGDPATGSSPAPPVCGPSDADRAAHGIGGQDGGSIGASGRPRRRRAVPAWDDILLGAKRPD
jgi:hypothetical protein